MHWRSVFIVVIKTNNCLFDCLVTCFSPIEFKLLNEYTNDKEISLDILEPQILIVFDAPLKVNLINKSFSKSMILHNFQSLSLVMGDKLVLSLNKNKIASYKLYKYLNSE